MPRVRVDVKWDESSQAFRAYDEVTGKALANYSQLTYGLTDLKTTDDATVAVKTFQAGSRNVNKLITLKAWVTV